MDNVYNTIPSNPKADVVLLKLDSDDAWFADASINGTPFKFLMDSGASKSVKSSKHFMSISDLFRPMLSNTRMKFQVANEEVINAMGVAHTSVQMYKCMFKLPIVVCDLGDLDHIFGMDAEKIAGFITYSCTGRIWFNANEMGESEQLSRVGAMQSAISEQLIMYKRIELKLFKAATIEVAYAKRAMSKHWEGSWVHCTTHSSLWANLGTIMMDGVADLSSSSAVLDFVNATPIPVVIKPNQNIATAVQIDFMETLPDIEPDDNKSIPAAESVFSCVMERDNFMYPCMISDEMMDADEDQFELDIDIVEAQLSRPRTIPRGKGTLIDCVQNLFTRNISPILIKTKHSK